MEGSDGAQGPDAPERADTDGSSGQESSGEGSRDGQRKGRTTRSEWIVAVVGALLVLGAMGTLLYKASAGPSSPPSIKVRIDSVVPSGSGYVVEFHAVNSGGSTAAALVVEGQLMQDTVSVQKSQVTLDYVPPEARSSGGLFFTKNPRDYRIDLRALGYDRP